MNVKLLKRIKRIILSRPQQFSMEAWFRKGFTEEACGTVACLCGWAVTISLQEGSKRKFKPLDTANALFPDLRVVRSIGAATMISRGMKVLDLSEDKARKLFFENNWPESLMSRYKRAEYHPDIRAKVTAERIDLFIATNGEE